MNLTDHDQNHRSLQNAAIYGLIVLLAFVIVFVFSDSFEYGSEKLRPILLITGVLFAAGIAAFLGLGQSLKVAVTEHRKLMFIIGAIAVSARLVAVFTIPILEIDYYRYLWDGKVLAAGVSPYQFSPEQVIAANAVTSAADGEAEDQRVELTTLVALADESMSNFTILNRIHFKEYTTIYPPVSQFVFGLTMKWFPDSASVKAHIVAIRLVLVLFDVGTLLLVYWMIRWVNLHPAWTIVYAWNPLVIKEVANSGHLDSIAAFFLTLAVLAVVRWRFVRADESKSDSNSFASSIWLITAGIALGLGFGAKLSPVVLFPALMVAVATRSWKRSLIFAATFFIVSAATMAPMLIHEGEVSEVSDELRGNKDGLIGFLSTWRMNDPIFSTIYLNLKSTKSSSDDAPWFVITTNDWRQRWIGNGNREENDSSNPAFFTTRILTLSAFAMFYLWQVVAIFRTGSAGESAVTGGESNERALRFINRLLWIMAVFLIVQPTVNPWYFLWIAPLACFYRNRGWLIVSGTLMIYYTRFWFDSLDEAYEGWVKFDGGVDVYDHLIVFLEFAFVAAVLVYFGNRSDQNKV